jgi:prolyl oligopeptidase
MHLHAAQAIAWLALAAAPDSGSATAPAYDYPATRRDDVVELVHGVQVADPYRWLEDGKSAEVQSWVKAQDAFARKHLADLPDRKAIAARLKELFYTEDVGYPRRRGHRWFYGKRAAKDEKWSVWWREGKKGPEHVVLSPAHWSADGHLSLGSWSVSWDGKRVAYAVKENNSDEATMHVMEVQSGKISVVDVIPGAKYATANWTPKGDGFYYTWIPTDPRIKTAERPGYAEMRFHHLGSNPALDPTVRPHNGDASTFLNTSLSKDGHWLMATIRHGWIGNDVYFQDLRQAGKHPWQQLASASDGIFWVSEYHDRFYVLTNWQAPTWRVLQVDPSHPSKDSWKEIVPSRSDATISGFTIVGGHLSLSYIQDVTSRVEVDALDGTPVRSVSLPGLGSASALLGEPDDDDAYYNFASFTQPNIVFETSVKTGVTTRWYEHKVPLDTSRFVIEQRKVRSKDGTLVPMFVVRDKTTKLDGSAPGMLTGYGGFASAWTPSFDAWVVPWLERGGIYAVANIRGGDEYGEDWHRHGMRAEKQNVFDDFNAAGEQLLATGTVAKDKLVIRGASNGGLLVGAALTQRPDLYRVALCGVPLLDMLRYHLFGSGHTWVEEYGSAENAADFKALFAYSPYQHVVSGTVYPATLILSADSDDRVDPMHARKFTAELQRDSRGGIVLLRVEPNAGHGGADLVGKSIEKVADELAFALSQIETRAR